MDYPILIAIALGAALLFFMLRPGGSPSQEKRPGRALIDHFEETGKDAAGSIVEKKLGEFKADEIARMMAAAFGSGSGPSSPPKP